VTSSSSAAMSPPRPAEANQIDCNKDDDDEYDDYHDRDDDCNLRPSYDLGPPSATTATVNVTVTSSLLDQSDQIWAPEGCKWVPIFSGSVRPVPGLACPPMAMAFAYQVP
jgi:hypothetical protein